MGRGWGGKKYNKGKEASVAEWIRARSPEPGESGDARSNPPTHRSLQRYQCQYGGDLDLETDNQDEVQIHNETNMEGIRVDSG